MQAYHQEEQICAYMVKIARSLQTGREKKPILYTGVISPAVS